MRLLKLDPGVTLRTHVGPGGRLVAHLGIRVPQEAFMTVARSQVRWREGALTVFDDSFPHSVTNPSADRARYILHVAFPLPTTAPVVPLVTEVGTEPPISSASTPRFRLDVYRNCSAVVTNLRWKTAGARTVAAPTTPRSHTTAASAADGACTVARAIVCRKHRVTAEGPQTLTRTLAGTCPTSWSPRDRRL